MTEKFISALTGNWEAELERQLLEAQDGSKRRKAYICSPCRAVSADGILKNMRAARFYMYYTFTQMGLIPHAPHAYLPLMLCDRVMSERALALRFGEDILEAATEMLICGNALTEGMQGELLAAVVRGIPITVYSPELYVLIKNKNSNHSHVKYDASHTPLALNADELFEDSQGGIRSAW